MPEGRREAARERTGGDERWAMGMRTPNLATLHSMIFVLCMTIRWSEFLSIDARQA